MRDRLIELLNVAVGDSNLTDGEVKIVADYLLANGVLVPPCKVGDTVYAEVVNTIEGFVITNFEFSVTPNGWSCGVTSSNGLYPMLFSFESIGKTVFFTKEEVEQKLKERNL